MKVSKWIACGPLAGSNSIRMVLPRGTFSCIVRQRDIQVSRVLVAFSETVQEHGSVGIPEK